MIDFQPIQPDEREKYSAYLHSGKSRGCEYSFANLYLWGRQKAAVIDEQMVLFSQFNRKTVYPYPAGEGEVKPVLEAIIRDSQERGIPCRITGLDSEDMAKMEEMFPGQFRYHCDRDSYDYVYAIDDLADLKGKKYQKKRNHINRFRENFPHYTIEPITGENLPQVEQMLEQWYAQRQEADPQGDYHMEKAAIYKALQHYEQLGLEGVVLVDEDRILAMTIGSRLTPDTYDIHFEKAIAEADTAYAVINCEFARFLRDKHPEIQFLNREDDLGIDGLRKAKLSYYPHHLVEKCWACLLEDGYDY